VSHVEKACRIVPSSVCHEAISNGLSYIYYWVVGLETGKTTTTIIVIFPPKLIRFTR